MEVDDPTIQQLTDALYDKCHIKHSGKLLDQDELLALGVIPGDDAGVLMECVNTLLSKRLLTLFLENQTPKWKVNSKEDIEKYKSMGADEAMIYTYIENSGRDGLWTRTLKSKANIHQSVITRCIKALENKGLIKSVFNVKAPTQKVYMLTSLAPTEQMTGGPWYQEGELDEDFIRLMSELAHKYVVSRSFVEVQAKRVAKKGKMSRAQASKERDQALGTSHSSGMDLLPLPPGYQNYPKPPEVRKHLNSLNVSQVTLDDKATSTLLDVLCYDGKLEKVMNGTAYKAVRSALVEGTQNNGFTEAPCGRCPVFNLCEEGGPVSASNCEYFKKWLEI